MQKKLVVFLLTVISTSGCSWFGAGDVQKRLGLESSKRVEIPAGLDSPPFVEAMPIPVIDDPRGLAGSNYEVRLPDALSTSFGVEQIVIKRLGDEKWVFLDLPPAVVWPKVVQFWEVNNLTVEVADPATGVLTSKWLAAHQGTAEQIFESLKQGNVFANMVNVTEHKFRLRIEPGIRSGSSEIYLQQKELSVGAPFRVNDDEWSGVSDNGELEAEFLRLLAYYLGETINPGTRSMVAGGIESSSRTQLVPDREMPVLKYQLDFNRAWATVGNALENARVPVEDLDRTSANYYVFYTSEHNPKPGFFGRLFRRGNAIESPGNRYTIHLSEAGNEVHVTVNKDADLADALIAERLLKVIKEFST